MDWVLSALTLLANFLIARKNRWGWLVSFLCSALWIYYALWMLDPPQFGLVPAAFVNMLISYYAMRYWRV